MIVAQTNKSFTLIPVRYFLAVIFSAILTASFTVFGQNTAPAEIDLTKAVVVAPGNLSPVENKAVTMLVEEIEKRTQIRLKRGDSFPTDGTPVITIVSDSGVKNFAGNFAPRLAAERGDGSCGRLPAFVSNKGAALRFHRFSWLAMTRAEFFSVSGICCGLCE